MGRYTQEVADWEEEKNKCVHGLVKAAEINQPLQAPRLNWHDAFRACLYAYEAGASAQERRELQVRRMDEAYMNEDADTTNNDGAS